MTGKKNRLKKSINLNNDKNHNTEQKEKSPGFSEEIHRIVTDNAFDMILMLDLNGSYLFSNNSAEDNLGYSQDEIKRGAGKQFDPKLSEIFLALFLKQ